MVNDLYDNYDNRVKDFVMDVKYILINDLTQMVHSPIKMKDYINPIQSTRMDLLKEEDAKITGRRGMILKGFKT